MHLASRIIHAAPRLGVLMVMVVGWAFCQTAATQTLTFISGPSGVIADSTIPPGSPPGSETAFISADLRGDGRRDLILGMGTNTNFAKQSVPMRILRPNPAGTAIVEVTRQLLGQGALPSTEHAHEVAVADFNGDGKLDIFVSGNGFEKFPWLGERNVLLIANADGTFNDRSATLPTVATD